jgi:hypothetical protein
VTETHAFTFSDRFGIGLAVLGFIPIVVGHDAAPA